MKVAQLRKDDEAGSQAISNLANILEVALHKAGATHIMNINKRGLLSSMEGDDEGDEPCVQPPTLYP